MTTSFDHLGKKENFCVEISLNNLQFFFLYSTETNYYFFIFDSEYLFIEVRFLWVDAKNRV